ncbi:VirB4 family type IV secretion/conjugal transfer ATPase [Acinetobacter baumannii]|nr:VirB4 family type IV secretion/conjugal transfer ATPase [Acinetobacter baumannii]
MRSKQQVKEIANADVAISDYLPFGNHVSNNVIKLKNGEYIGIWRLEGITFETVEADIIQIRKEGLNNFYRALGGGHFAVWTHKIRRNVNERLNGKYSNAFIADFNERYYKQFEGEKNKQMATELYLTVLYRPEISKAAKFFKKRATRDAEVLKKQLKRDLDVFEDIAKQVESSLHHYNVERLETYEKKGFIYSELNNLLGFLTNGVWEEIPLRQAGLDQFIPTSRLFFGDKNGYLQIKHPKETKYVGFLDIQEFPRRSESGMCNSILYGNYEYIETQSFAIYGKRDAVDKLKTIKGQLNSVEDVSPQEVKDIEQAMADVNSGNYQFGEYHYTLAVFGNTPTQVAQNISHARTALSDEAGFKMAVIDSVPESAWFAQLAGNFNQRPREAYLTSLNFAALSPFHSFARGKKYGNPWGEALALFKTPSGQPFFFNHHVSPEDEDNADDKMPGNTCVIGTTGVGKTTLVIAMLMLACKYENLRGVFFDKDRGAEIAIRRIGGQYYALERGVPTGFNPLQLEPTKSNIEFVNKLVKILVGGTRNASEDLQVEEAVKVVMNDSMPMPLRRMSAVYMNLKVESGGDSLRDRLAKWVHTQDREGGLAWVFDNPIDTQDFTKAKMPIFGYDYTEFLDDAEVRTPIMAYLLHITEFLIDGNPFIYWMDEFWKPLLDPYFKDFSKDKQKTIRKLNGLGVFMTQSPSDVLDSDIGKTMVEQSVTQIFLPNPRADRTDYVDGFKVTPAEFEIIRSLGENSRMFLVKQGSRSSICKMDLGDMRDVLQIISGSKDNVAIMEEVISEVGEDPEVWSPIFLERIAERKKLISQKGVVSS